MLRVMGTLFLCVREPVHSGGRDYDFTISENESTILLFWVGRDYDFTDRQEKTAAQEDENLMLPLSN